MENKDKIFKFVIEDRDGVLYERELNSLELAMLGTGVLDFRDVLIEAGKVLKAKEGDKQAHGNERQGC